MNSLLVRARRYFPDALAIDGRERARSLFGALLGLLLTGLLSQAFVGAWSHDATLPWLLAPMGASAVLLFAVPASPLAQPWSVLGGNIVSALVGVSCAGLIGDPAFAASVAVGGAIAAMFALRCVHPPGGAVALSAVLGGPAIAQTGYAFALMPVALNSLLLLAIAIVYNKACGRRYPHFTVPHTNQHHTADSLPTERLGITPGDLDAALKQYNQVLDISRDDLEEILLRTERQAYERHCGRVTCAAIMSRDVVTVTPDLGLWPAWRLLQTHDVKALPVVNAARHVVGIVTQDDFIKHCEFDSLAGFSARLRKLLRQPQTVGDIMASAVRTAGAEQPIAALVPLLSNAGIHHLPVVDGEQRLVGILSQSDLVAALYRVGLEGPAPSRPRLQVVNG